jgi:hypothetical protein
MKTICCGVLAAIALGSIASAQQSLDPQKRFDQWKALASSCPNQDACKGIVKGVKVSFKGESFDGVQIDSPTGPTVYFGGKSLTERGWAVCWYDDLVSSNPTITCVLL